MDPSMIPELPSAQKLLAGCGCLVAALVGVGVGVGWLIWG